LTGFIASLLLLVLYFGALTAISGLDFTLTEFARYWYYIVPLAAGFGVQVELFARLRRLVAGTTRAGAVVGASGTTSTVAMVSCCAHYLTTAAPVLGATGLVAFAAHFQVELFWLGLAFNGAGIAFIGSRLAKASKEHAQCAT